ncbi:MAG: acetate--CoA ligase family protein [Chloroherpetonaceae bacterium]
MLNSSILNPKSIAIIGASNDITKPGGKVLKNLLFANFSKNIYPVNPKESIIQGLKCYNNISQLPETDCAILAIPASAVNETVQYLAENKNTRGFIVFSAGFGELNEEGKKLESELKAIIKKYNANLIGPNSIGVLNTNYAGVFAGAIPKLEINGVDFVTGSGATAVFIVEQAILRGLPFSSVYSVGNSAQIGVEEVLEYWDETFTSNVSKVKMIYIEQVHNPEKFYKHTSTLIKKGAKIIALKAGSTDSGARAVSSHTGALAGSDTAVDALFKKAGIIRCFSRDELVTVACVLMYKELHGKNLAVITHAGGPGILCTDQLIKDGFKVPKIEGADAKDLLDKLFYGSSVSNPIDFLATGTPEQLGLILDYVENKFDNIDGSIVIYGTPGLFDVTPAYDLLNEKINNSKKPIFPVLPSPVQTKDAIEHFISLGNAIFPDETRLAEALARVYNSPKYIEETQPSYSINYDIIRDIIKTNEKGKFLSPENNAKILDAIGIPRATEILIKNESDLDMFSKKISYPVVMKIIGPVHKTDVGGVILNIQDDNELRKAFAKIISIPNAEGALIQPMLKGTELYIGVKKEETFGHLIFFGLGGIFIEVIKDVAYELSPFGKNTADRLIKSIHSYPMIEGVRGQKGINQEKLIDIILRISELTRIAPEISEMDINPLIATEDDIYAIDIRIKIG